MQYIIFAVLVIFAFGLRNSKKASILLIGFCILLCAFCTDSYDLLNLKDSFENPMSKSNVAFGWDFFFTLCVKSGMSYTWFKAICGTITLTLIYFAVKKGTKNISLVISLYALCLFMSQLTQIRNGMASAFALLGFMYLIDDNRKGTIKYFICMFFAISVHYSMAFYLLFIIIKPNIFKEKYVFGMIIALFGVVILAYSNILYNLAVAIFPNQVRLTSYLDMSNTFSKIDSHSIKTIIIVLGEHILFYFIFLCIYNPSVIDTERLYMGDIQKRGSLNIKKQQMIYKALVLLFILLPFYIVTPTFFRLFKNMMPLIYIMAGNALELSKIKNGECRENKTLITIILTICTLLLWLGEAYTQGEGFKTLDSFDLGIHWL